MRFRGTLILLILCLALGVFLYFYEIKGGERRSKEKEAANQVWKLESGEVQQLELVGESERIVAARVDDKTWKITAPRAVEADSSEVNRLVGSAAAINRESVVEAEAADLTKYGLEPPQQSVRLKTRDGREYGIRFGNNNPTGYSTYAALEGSREVFLVASYTASNLRKKLDDLRNYTVLAFDQYEAQSLDIRNPKGEVRLAKEEDRWWIQGKQKWYADSSEVNSALSSLANGRLKEFFDDDPEDYTNLGLDKPMLDIRVTVGKDKAIKQLLIGAEKSVLVKKGLRPARATKPADSTAKLYVARDESRKELFFVDQEFVDKFLKSPADFRSKALAVFQRWDVDGIVLTNSRGTVTFAKSETGGDWLVGAEKKKAKWEAVNGVLDALEKQVQQFVEEERPPAAYGLDKPAVRVVLKQKGEEKVDCSFGNQTKDGVYALVKGESAVKLVAKEILEKLDKEEKDFIETPPPPAPKQ